MNISYSEMRTLQRCPREHHYRYDLRRLPVVDARPLVFGREVHRLLERLWTDDTLTTSSDPVAAALLAGYRNHWGIRTGRTNVRFERDLGSGVTLTGYADATADGVIYEHKTVSSRTNLDHGADWSAHIEAMDAQVSAYLLGLPDHERVVYDVIRKPTIKQRDNETDKAWAERLTRDTLDRPEHYYTRIECVRSRAELDEFAEEVRRVALAERSAVRNTSACYSFFRRCDYYDVCRGRMRIEDYGRA